MNILKIDFDYICSLKKEDGTALSLANLQFTSVGSAGYSVIQNDKEDICFKILLI